METFDHVLNWKLKRGSHAFPGSDGGTCINEAAIVAAGFRYQRVDKIEEMPACFSRPICALALLLNDVADNENRQRLLPFVTRLACADTPDVEARRRTFISRAISRYLGLISFEEGLQVLEGALSIGQQADLFPGEDVRARMDAAQGNAETSQEEQD